MKFAIGLSLILPSVVVPQLTPECDELTVGHDLLRCPLPVWSTAEEETSAEDPLQIEYRTVVKPIPAINQTSGSVIPGEFVNFTLKTYHLDGYEPTVPSPVWYWEKGAVVHINLTNNLHINYQEDTDEFQVPESEWDEEHWSINIHTHGLHISSKEDDPSRTIHVSESGLYEFNVPGNHAGGMHWYHPHIEAVSEITVGSGTFGPLVIETAEGGVELPPLVEELEANHIVIAKIYPAKLLDLSDGFEADTDAIDGVYPRRDITDSTFKVEYNESLESSLQILEENTNFTLINGFLKPKVTVQNNQWYRFAFLFAGGSDEEADLADVKFRVGVNTDMNPDEETDFGEMFSEENAACITKLIAKDGVYLRQSRDLDFDNGDRIWAAPANRFEVLMKCKFDVPDEEEISLDNTLALIMDTPTEPNRAEPENIKHSVPVMQIEIVHVPFGDDPTALTDEDDSFQSTACHPSYLRDLRGDVTVTPQVQSSYSAEINATIRPETMNGDFYDMDTGVLNFTVSPFNVNGDYFRGYFSDDKALNMTVLELQNIYEFNLQHGHHPLHIHVNHMQLQTAADDGSGYHQPGDFVDTLTSACVASGCVNAPPRPHVETTNFRMYIDRYDGRMIGHCHNMDHSDSLALGEMWVLPSDEDLFAVEPTWADTCTDELELV